MIELLIRCIQEFTRSANCHSVSDINKLSLSWKHKSCDRLLHYSSIFPLLYESICISLQIEMILETCSPPFLQVTGYSYKAIPSSHFITQNEDLDKELILLFLKTICYCSNSHSNPHVYKLIYNLVTCSQVRQQQELR